MKLASIILSFLYLLLISSCFEKHISHSKELRVNCKGSDNLKPCLNQKVSITGTLAGSKANHPKDMILQHPIEANFNEEKQFYMRISDKYGQIVLISKDELNCPQKITLSGQLTQKKIECSPEQKGKCPYSNFFIKVQKWHCVNK